MNPDDVLLWTDGFWCFREEFGPDFLRDDSFRVLPRDSDEWHGCTSQPGPPAHSGGTGS